MSAASLINVWESLTSRLRGIGQWIPPLILRLIMGWEFWESGTEKYSGDNWFTQIQDKFPFPFSKIPADISWAMAADQRANNTWRSREARLVRLNVM